MNSLNQTDNEDKVVIQTTSASRKRLHVDRVCSFMGVVCLSLKFLLGASVDRLSAAESLKYSNPVLQTASALLQLTKIEALKGRDVAMAGIVLLVDGSDNSVYLADITGAVRVRGVPPPISSGDLLQVKGVSTFGYAPEMVARDYSKQGNASLPYAQPVSKPVLWTGNHEYQWRQITGLVTKSESSARGVMLTLSTPFGNVEVLVLKALKENGENWVRRRITIQGVVRATLNPQGQFSGAQLWVDGADQVRVNGTMRNTLARTNQVNGIDLERMNKVTAGAKGLTNRFADTSTNSVAFQPRTESQTLETADPQIQNTNASTTEVTNTLATTLAVALRRGIFQSPLSIISTELMSYGTSAGKVRSEGVVIFQASPNRFYCVDSTGPIRVLSAESQQLKSGDHVEIVGFPTLHDNRPYIGEATVRKLGVSALPNPIPVSSSDASKGKYDGMRVSMRGKVVGHDGSRYARSLRDSVVVQDESGLFRANFDKGSAPWEALPIGTIAEFTGMSVIENFLGNGGSEPHVYLSGLDQLKIIEQSSYWTSKRFSQFSVIVLSLTGVVVGGWMIQRRQLSMAQSSESRFRALVEHSFDITLVLNANGTVRYVSPSGERLFGEACRPGTDLAMRAEEFVHDDDLKTVFQAFDSLLTRPGASHSLESCRISTPSGALRSVEAIATNCLSVKGVEGIVINLRDVTDRREAQRQLELAAAEQRRINADLERRIETRTAELRATNLQLQGEVQERARAGKVQKAFFEISEGVHAAQDLPSLYERIHSIVATLMPADNFYLALQNFETGIVSFPYHRD